MALPHQAVWAAGSLSWEELRGKQGAGVRLPEALPSPLHVGGGGVQGCVSEGRVNRGTLPSPQYSEEGGLPKGPLAQHQGNCWH